MGAMALRNKDLIALQKLAVRMQPQYRLRSEIVKDE